LVRRLFAGDFSRNRIATNGLLSRSGWCYCLRLL